MRQLWIVDASDLGQLAGHWSKSASEWLHTATCLFIQQLIEHESDELLKFSVQIKLNIFYSRVYYNNSLIERTFQGSRNLISSKYLSNILTSKTTSELTNSLRRIYLGS